jgi:hypothetical protein
MGSMLLSVSDQAVEVGRIEAQSSVVGKARSSARHKQSEKRYFPRARALNRVASSRAGRAPE